jgi:membrane associated rhomboid family serine protease
MIPLYDRNPTRKTPVVTLALILANVAVFIYMLFLNGSGSDIFFYRFSVVPWEIVHARQLPMAALQQLFSFPISIVPSKQVYLPLMTSLFIHDGWLHIGGNMLYLWIFGNNVEDVMGRIPFIGFYFLCGLFGTFTQVAVHPNAFNLMLGASGAISGLLGAYLILYPRTWIYTLVIFFIIPVPAFVVIGFWIVLQFIEGLTSAVGGAGGTAWFAHLGGVAIGLIATGIFYPVLRRRRDAFKAEAQPDWRR